MISRSSPARLRSCRRFFLLLSYLEQGLALTDVDKGAAEPVSFRRTVVLYLCAGLLVGTPVLEIVTFCGVHSRHHHSSAGVTCRCCSRAPTTPDLVLPKGLASLSDPLLFLDNADRTMLGQRRLFFCFELIFFVSCWWFMAPSARPLVDKKPPSRAPGRATFRSRSLHWLSSVSRVCVHCLVRSDWGVLPLAACADAVPPPPGSSHPRPVKRGVLPPLLQRLLVSFCCCFHAG